MWFVLITCTLPVPGFCKSDKEQNSLSFLVADCFTALQVYTCIPGQQDLSWNAQDNPDCEGLISLWLHFLYQDVVQHLQTQPYFMTIDECSDRNSDQSLCHCGLLLHKSFRYHIPGHANLYHWNCIEFFDHLQKNFLANNKHSLVTFGWICVWQL